MNPIDKFGTPIFIGSKISTVYCNNYFQTGIVENIKQSKKNNLNYNIVIKVDKSYGPTTITRPATRCIVIASPDIINELISLREQVERLKALIPKEPLGYDPEDDRE